MIFLSTIFILLFAVKSETKNIYKAYGENFVVVANGRDDILNVADDDSAEPLGLVIVDYKQPKTRRNAQEPINSAETNDEETESGDEDEEDDALEQRARGKHRKRHKKKRKHIDPEPEPEPEVVKKHKRTIKKSKPEPKPVSSRSLEKGEERAKELRSKCLSENAKCTRACNRAHEDVCDRLDCSARSKAALRTECTFYCQKVFDPKEC